MDEPVTQDGRPARITAGRLVLTPDRVVGLLAIAAIAFLVLCGFGFKGHVG